MDDSLYPGQSDKWSAANYNNIASLESTINEYIL